MLPLLFSGLDYSLALMLFGMVRISLVRCRGVKDISGIILRVRAA